MNRTNEKRESTKQWLIVEYGGGAAVVFAWTRERAMLLYTQDCLRNGRKPAPLTLEETRWSRLDQYLTEVGQDACDRGVEGIAYLEIGRGWLICRPGDIRDVSEAF